MNLARRLDAVVRVRVTAAAVEARLVVVVAAVRPDARATREALACGGDR